MSRRPFAARFAVCTAMAVLAVAAPASAAKVKGNGNGGSATCSATPNPVAVNSDYVVNASGLAAGSMVNVFVQDAMGTNWWSAMPDAIGTIQVPGHAYWAGTSSVRITSSGRTVATCSFDVR